jgi:hypothetical protein
MATAGSEGGGATAEGSALAFMRALVANEVLKAQIRRERQERDAWIGWPARVAANMAAEPDAHDGSGCSTATLREHLAELGEGRCQEA